MVPTVSNSTAPVTFDWDFDDLTPHSTNQFATHIYHSPGFYLWTVVATVSGKSTVDAGMILVGDPVQLNLTRAGDAITLLWPDTIADTLLETTAALGLSAHWAPVTNTVNLGPNTLSVTVSPTGNQFFRVRQLW